MAHDFVKVAEEFINVYNKTFDEDREKLSDLYRPHSMLTFESASVLGASKIVEKLSSLPFQKVTHQVLTLDAQPTMVDGGIIILVTGKLHVDNEAHEMKYTQAFQLAREANGLYFVYNDIFKLVFD